MSPLIEALAGDSARGYGFGLPNGAASSFESIATVTATGSETSLTFSGIPSTYKALQIRGITRQTTNSGGSILYMQANSSSSNYARHMLYGTGSAAGASGAASQSSIHIASQTADGAINSSIFTGVIIDVQDYASSTKNKTVRSFFGTDSNGAFSNWVGLSSGLWADTTAISSLTFTQYSGAFSAGSKFALYGIKGA